MKMNEEVYKKYYPLVQSTCYRKLLDKSYTEDAIQTTFYIYLSESEKEKNDLGSWFYWTSNNVCKKINADISKSNKLLPIKLNNNKNDLDDDGVNLESALNLLSPSKMNLIIMKYFEGLSDDDIACKLKTNKKSIQMKLFHALKILKQKLKKNDVYVSSLLFSFFIKDFKVTTLQVNNLGKSLTTKQMKIVKELKIMNSITNFKLAVIGIVIVAILAPIFWQLSQVQVNSKERRLSQSANEELKDNILEEKIKKPNDNMAKFTDPKKDIKENDLSKKTLDEDFEEDNNKKLASKQTNNHEVIVKEPMEIESEKKIEDVKQAKIETIKPEVIQNPTESVSKVSPLNEDLDNLDSFFDEEIPLEKSDEIIIEDKKITNEKALEKEKLYPLEINPASDMFPIKKSKTEITNILKNYNQKANNILKDKNTLDKYYKWTEAWVYFDNLFSGRNQTNTKEDDKFMIEHYSFPVFNFGQVYGENSCIGHGIVRNKEINNKIIKDLAVFKNEDHFLNISPLNEGEIEKIVKTIENNKRKLFKEVPFEKIRSKEIELYKVELMKDGQYKEFYFLIKNDKYSGCIYDLWK
jgi:RNA polymerase sigma factor (sigma-70 family)